MNPRKEFICYAVMVIIGFAVSKLLYWLYMEIEMLNDQAFIDWFTDYCHQLCKQEFKCLGYTIESRSGTLSCTIYDNFNKHTCSLHNEQCIS